MKKYYKVSETISLSRRPYLRNQMNVKELLKLLLVEKNVSYKHRHTADYGKLSSTITSCIVPQKVQVVVPGTWDL